MNISLSKLNRLMVLSGLAATMALTGCAGVHNSMRLSSKDSMWNPVSKLKAEKEKDAEPTEPVTMVATWKGAVYETAGKDARGFGGRIFFYDAANNAVEADGELTVYGFDDSTKKSNDSSPDKKFVFRASEFQTHKTVNGLGASYSIWIPWEKVGGYRKTISLIPIFKTSSGKILKGGQSVNVLHGKTPDRQLSDNGPFKVLGSSSAVLSQADYNDETSSDNGVVQASFERQSSENKIRTSTINLTPNMARRVEANHGAPRRSQSRIATDDEQLKKLRQMIDERNSTTPVSVSKETPAADQNTEPTAMQRRPFGSPGSFK